MTANQFEEALRMKVSLPTDLPYPGGSIALIALALYFTHASEKSAEPGEKH